MSSTITAIYIDNVQRFGMLNNQVSSARKIYGFTKCTFNLFIYSKMFEYRLALFIKLYNALQFRRNSLYVRLYFFVNTSIIYMDIGKISIEEIS